MENKQTAVQWLIQERSKHGFTTLKDLEEALKIEKEQIMDDFMAGKWDWQKHLDTGNHLIDPAIYYRDTYGK